MNFRVLLRLDTDAGQSASLERLQAAFAEVCSVLGRLAQQTRCWNRVALHHLAYKDLRTRYPRLGSQMICNAIYSVSRTARLVYQNPASPWSTERRPGKSLPVLRFSPSAPVYFDRHTLSLQGGRLSLFTLDGRLRFDVSLRAEDERRFREERLKELVLSRDAQGFFLVFSFGDAVMPEQDSAELPDYLLIVDEYVQSTSIV